MSEEILLSQPKKVRADALRNRQLILDVAREAFAEGGASVTLEDIVRRSGLGVGTLYRHFPTRDALVSAVYVSELEKLAEASREFSETMSPLEALRHWIYVFIEYLGTKIAMRELLDGLMCESKDVQNAASELLQNSIDSLTARAVASGEIQMNDIEPLDLLRAVYGVATSSPNQQWQQSARRMADVMLAGLCSPAS